MKNEHAAFAERLRQLLLAGKFDMRRVELVKQLARHGKVAVTQQTMSGWLNGKHLPKPDAMRGLARMLGTRTHLLQFGGETSTEVREPRMQWPEYVSGRDRLLFEEFLALPHKQREVVRELIGSLAAAAPMKQRRN